MNDKNEEVISDLFGILDCHEHYYEARDEVFAFLINILTAERTKNPGVWDGAPEGSNLADISFYTSKERTEKSYAGFKTHTRELPKTRAREIAEKRALEDGRRLCLGTEEIFLLANDYEAAILEYAEAIK